MLDTLFKRKKPSVYLGTLAVVPRSDMKRYFDQCWWYKSADNDLDKGMRDSLKEFLLLPSAQDVIEPIKIGFRFTCHRFKISSRGNAGIRFK